MPTCIADQTIYVNNERIVHAGEEFEYNGPIIKAGDKHVTIDEETQKFKVGKLPADHELVGKVSRTGAFHLKSDDEPVKAAPPKPPPATMSEMTKADADAKAKAAAGLHGKP